MKKTLTLIMLLVFFTVLITEAQAPVATFTASDTVVCPGNSVTFTNNSTGTIDSTLWTFGGGAKPDSSMVFSPTIKFATPGNYRVILKETNTNGSDTVGFTIMVVNKLQVYLSPVSPVVCSGGAILLTASGGTSYAWSTGSTADTTTVHPTKDSIYYVLVMNGGCAKDTSIAVIVNIPPSLIILPKLPTVCTGQPVILSVPVTGSNYIWSPAAGLSTTTGDTTIILNPTANVTYTVTGLDSLGCVVSASDTITVIAVPNKPTITISVTGDSLISSADTGNQWYYNGNILPGDTNQVLIINGNPCDYSVSVTGPNGCSTMSGDSASAPPFNGPCDGGINRLSGIDEQVTIYPNPLYNNTSLKIDYNVKDVNDWSLELTDVLGRTLYTKPSLNYSNEIALLDLSGGIYFITVVNKTDRGVFEVVKE